MLFGIMCSEKKEQCCTEKEAYMGTLTDILGAEGKAMVAELEGNGATADSRRMASLIKAADTIVAQSSEEDRPTKELLFGLTLTMANHIITEEKRSNTLDKSVDSRIAGLEDKIKKVRNGLAGATNILKGMDDSAPKSIGMAILSIVAPLYPMRHVLIVAILSPFTADLVTRLIPLLSK